MRPSKLDAFKPLIHKLVLTDGLSCVRVLEEIRAVGYMGGDNILKLFVKTFRPKPGRRPHLRFETAPGVQGQVDLSPYTVLLSGEPTNLVCFSFVLGFSRWHFIRFLLHADVHSICHCHVLAFEDAGGVPHEILYDRMKQVVLESLKDGVIFHALFERMAQHYGFRAVPLAPGYKEGKGKIENPFKYVEGNFLAGRTFADLDDLNGQAQQWLIEIARVRVHRTTQEQPAARLTQEQPSLIPLPDRHGRHPVLAARRVRGALRRQRPRDRGRSRWGRR
jgi:transposase